jgi:GH25 family lysozyme M1 (1,4-beta-N-acetylmuramidase)
MKVVIKNILAIWINMTFGFVHSVETQISKKMDIMATFSQRKLDGADGWVDINTFNGTSDEWNKYLHK